MTDKAEFVIGGKTYSLGPLPIWSLERCWAAIEALSNPSPSPFQRARTYLEIIAAGVQLTDPDVGTEDLSKRLHWSESLALAPGIVKLLNISGFKAQGAATDTGEASAAVDSPSTETGSPSSPS